ncbi:cytochrome P450 [Podospora australis]|uniref:Cytochrome P450 n=1 Tax=Podospora australis TaxID=1536484 RepID=A0AAN7AGG9_9PEZI|nr:cytochrome P450 [Podospora australis]
MMFPYETVALSAAIAGAYNSPFDAETWLSDCTKTFIHVLIFICLPFAILNRLYFYPLLISPLRDIPSAPQAPVHKRLLKEVRGLEPLQWLTNVPNRGLIRYFGLLNVECLFVTTPAAFKEILDTKNYRWIKPPKSSSLFKLIIGDGLITLEGPHHKEQRKLLQSSFGFRQIQDLYPTFWGKAIELLDCMTRGIGSRGSGDDAAVLDIQDWMGRAALDMIGLAGFGFKFDSVSNPEGELVRQYRRLFGIKPAPVAQVLAHVIPTSLLRFLPIQALEDVRVSTGAIKAYLSKAIQEMRVTLAKTGGGQKPVVDRDVLSVAMRDAALSEQQLIDHAMTFLGAGQDTTAFALTCAVMELSQNPELQERLRQEIRANLPSPASPGFCADYPIDPARLPWLTATVNETLRCYPSVDAIGRVSLDADAFVAGHRIPKGSIVNIPVGAVNRYGEFWSGSSFDPAKWCPERWLDHDDGAKLNPTGGAVDPWVMMTFSRGARQCIGERFARAEMAVVLAALVGRFRFELRGASGKGKPMEDLDIFYGFTGCIAGGLWTGVEVVPGW